MADYASVRSSVTDGRRSTPGSIDDCGFALVDAPSAVRDWRDETRIDEVHGPEMRALALEFTDHPPGGASSTYCSPALDPSKWGCCVEGDRRAVLRWSSRDRESDHSCEFVERRSDP